MTFGLEEGEQISVIIRKHWIVFAGFVLLIAIAAVVPFFLYRFLPTGLFGSVQTGGAVVAFAYFSWLILLWIVLFDLWTTYYLDIWVVTDRKIIDIDQRSLFHRELITTRLEKVQDVTINTEGLLQTLLSFGTVIIHTAGENADFVIQTANNPERARAKILNVHSAMLERALHHPADAI